MSSKLQKENLVKANLRAWAIRMRKMDLVGPDSLVARLYPHLVGSDSLAARLLTHLVGADSLEALTEQVDPMVSSVRWTR